MYRCITFAILLFALSAHAQGESVPSDCTAHDSVKARYAHDAAWMAMLHLLDTDSANIDEPHIPQSLQDTFMRALLAVYNAPLPARDTVVFGLHYYTAKAFSLNKLSVFGDAETPWIVRLSKKDQTDHPSIDSIISAYGITVEDVLVFGTRLFLTIQTDKFYNTQAIAKVFNAVSFGTTDPYSYIGDGDHISGKVYQSEIHLTYSIGWEDCPAGCISRRYFRFTVYPDCSVRFDSSYGSVLGDFKFPDADVQDNTSSSDGLRISPNPASESVTVYCVSSTNLEIVNAEGQVVKKVVVTEPRSEVSLLDMPNGLYFIRPEGGTHGETVKFIKQ